VGFIARDTLPNDDQCQALFDAFVELGEPTWGLAMRLAHLSGLRWGELIALRPADVDFEPHRIVRVERAVEQSRRGRVFKEPKNSQRRSSIFAASLTGELSAHLDRVGAEHGAEALLFADPDGQPPERGQFSRLWHRAGSRAGWPMRSKKATVWHPHDLRHVAACWMLFDVGIDPPVVARMLGHANAAFTLSRYVGVRTGADVTTNKLTEEW
jgi:integrase